MKKDRKNYFGLIFSLIFLFIILIGINIKDIENFNKERLLLTMIFGVFIIFIIGMYEGFATMPVGEPDPMFKTGHTLIFYFFIIGVIIVPICLYVYSCIIQEKNFEEIVYDILSLLYYEKKE